MSKQIKIDKCTSCGSDQIVVAGNKFLCRVCNIVYEVTDTGTKVLDANPLDEHEQRLANAERDIAVLKKAGQGGETVEPPETPAEGIEPETDEVTDEDETQEDGFIIFE
jgi:hypothetical protein